MSGSLQTELRRVVSEHFPDELEAFDFAAPELLQLARRNTSQQQLRRSSGLPSELGPAVYEVLQHVALIWGAVKAMKEAVDFIGLSGSKRTRAIENLAAELERAGIESALAKAIALKYGEDILSSR